jgi:lysophospholipase L1-like esterase
VRLDRHKYQESRGVRPKTILIALIAVNVCLGIIAYLFPPEGLFITKNLGLKFPAREEVFSMVPREEVVVDVDSVLQGLDLVNETEMRDSVDSDLLAQLNKEAKAIFVYDSLKKKWVVGNSRGIVNAESLREFFQALMYQTDSQVVRIVHYGDSQLEGDRISDYLRNRLQLLFGGGGPGMVLPLEPTAGARRTALVRHSPNMKKHAVYVKGSAPPKNYYGIGGSSFEIQGFYERTIGYDTSYGEKLNEEDSLYYPDTVITPIFETVDKNTAYLQVFNAKRGYPKVRSYDRIRLLYSAQEAFGIVMTADTVRKEEIVPAAEYGMKEWLVPTDKSVRVDFLQGQFPLLFGMALDGTKGVALDNFPMRGSSDIGFTRANTNIYSSQLESMNVKLIILQYGVNVIPYVVSDYSYYKRRLAKEIQSLKTAYPDVAVLVIGPSDMSRNKGGEYASYPNIELVRDAMKAAADETNSAFWDLYQAMGGENSMIAWVDKGYANKDYTHFSNKGAKYVGEMLFEALLEQMVEMDVISLQD